ncbi:MAG: hypothetical protein ACK41D_09770 [Rubricoccaceae bacterium]
MPSADRFPDRGAIRFQRVRDFGEIVRAGFLLVRETFREFAAGMLLVAGPALLAGAIAQLLAQQSLFAQGSRTDDDVLAASGSLLSMQLFGLAALVFALATGYAYLRLYRQGEAGRITPGVLWESTKPLVLPMLTVTLVVVFLIVLLATVVSVLAVGLGMIAPPLAVLAALAALGAGLWVAPAYLLVYPARAFGAGSVFDAIALTVHLLRARWRRAFGVMFVLVVLYVVLAVALTIPIALVGGIGALISPEGPPGLLVSALVIVGTLVQAAVTYPILTAVSAMLFASIAEEQSGASLLADLQMLEAGAPEPGEAPLLTRPVPSDAPEQDPSGEREAHPQAAEREEDGDVRGEGFRGGGFRGGGFGR